VGSLGRGLTDYGIVRGGVEGICLAIVRQGSDEFVVALENSLWLA
jgi:hypothetical protein